MRTDSLKKSMQKGFTLVELLIVVIILAILAAIVVPQFSASTDDAKVSSLKSTLAGIRSALDIYYQQHGHYPSFVAATGTAACAAGTPGAGAINTAAAFTEQMTTYTRADGAACTQKNGTPTVPVFSMGPYLKQAVPADPITGTVSTITVVTTGDLAMIADGTAGGWKYDNKTGRFIMNHTDYDDL